MNIWTSFKRIAITLTISTKLTTLLSAQENNKLISNFLAARDEANQRAMQPQRFADMNNTELTSQIGMNKTKFDELIQICQLTSKHDPYQTLGYYLYRLRTGLSEEQIGQRFNLKQQAISYHLTEARKALNSHFLNRFLSLRVDEMNDDFFIRHSTFPGQRLFSRTKRKLVLDSTYCRILIQKSADFFFQRLTYSLHKHLNLFCMFMVITLDGYIVMVTSPFPANVSDAEITEDLV